MTLFNREQLARIEGYLANDQTSEILPALQGLVADMEAHWDEMQAIVAEEAAKRN